MADPVKQQKVSWHCYRLGYKIQRFHSALDSERLLANTDQALTEDSETAASVSKLGCRSVQSMDFAW